MKCQPSQSSTVFSLLKQEGYETDPVAKRRIERYPYQANTTILLKQDHIKLRTELPIKGVYHVLFLKPDGSSHLDFEFFDEDPE